MSSNVSKLSDNVHVLIGRTNVGLIRLDERDFIVIDTGLDEDYGRRIYNVLKNLGLNLRAVVNTHSHADHIGGNELLVKRLGVSVYASSYEKPFIELPLIEVIYLYGSMPPKPLRSKLLMARGVKARDIEEVKGELGLEILELPGHSPGMLGFAKDGILFSADAFFPPEILSKYVIPYHIDAKRAWETLNVLNNIIPNYNLIVPSHGKVHAAPEALTVVRENMKVIEKIRNTVLEAMGEGRTPFEEIIYRILKSFNIGISNPHTYMLYRSAVSSYISWLVDDGLADIEVADNTLFVRRIS